MIFFSSAGTQDEHGAAHLKRGGGAVDAGGDRVDAVDCLDDVGTIAEAMRAPMPPIGSRRASPAPRAVEANSSADGGP